MAKLSRNIVMVLFATLLGTTLMMFKGVEGQEICHDVLKAPGNGICDAKSCKDQCAAKWNGSGLCSVKLGALTSVFILRSVSALNHGALGGDLYDHESLVSAIKQVDIVISTVGTYQLADQGRIIEAIREVGNVKVRCLQKLQAIV
ncbi:NmrA-like protein, partial [Corchorus capsularis]